MKLALKLLYSLSNKPTIHYPNFKGCMMRSITTCHELQKQPLRVMLTFLLTKQLFLSWYLKFCLFFKTILWDESLAIIMNVLPLRTLRILILCIQMLEPLLTRKKFPTLTTSLRLNKSYWSWQFNCLCLAHLNKNMATFSRQHQDEICSDISKFNQVLHLICFQKCIWSCKL